MCAANRPGCLPLRRRGPFPGRGVPAGPGPSPPAPPAPVALRSFSSGPRSSASPSAATASTALRRILASGACWVAEPARATVPVRFAPGEQLAQRRRRQPARQRRGQFAVALRHAAVVGAGLLAVVAAEHPPAPGRPQVRRDLAGIFYGQAAQACRASIRPSPRQAPLGQAPMHASHSPHPPASGEPGAGASCSQSRTAARSCPSLGR